MSKSKKVWVADDDESIRFVLEKGLIDAGFEVSVFEDGNEVVNQLDLEKPNVLLTDLKMPGRDGMDLLDTFKNEFSKKNTKVFLEVRGKKHPASICSLPFYKKSYVK